MGKDVGREPACGDVMHNCEYIVSWNTEPDGDGDPIYCDRPAPIKFNDAWFCAEHYDEVIEYENDEDA
jgi:hypothetical protein